MSEPTTKYGPRGAEGSVSDAQDRNRINPGAVPNPCTQAYRVALGYLAGEHDNSARYRSFVKRGELQEVRDRIQEREDAVLLSDELDGKNAETRAAQMRQILREQTDYPQLQEQRRELEREIALIDIEIERLTHAMRIARLEAETLAYRGEREDRSQFLDRFLGQEPGSMER